MQQVARMIPDPCPRCGHTTHPTHAVGHFLPTPEFRPNYPNAPTYPTRAEAVADQCDWQARRPLEGQEPLL